MVSTRTWFSFPPFPGASPSPLIPPSCARLASLAIFSSPPRTYILKPLRTASFRVSAELPARDRIIDFGKYKGQMLGTLPSKYLKWVSKNLRARDYEEWAKLADQVLGDPYYGDRLEWESAERILRGNESRDLRSESPVSDLLEISKRFGWDNEDKEGWKRVDFALLGTSKGGRIPRIRAEEIGPADEGGRLEIAGGTGTQGAGSLQNEERGSGVFERKKAGVLRERFRCFDIDDAHFEMETLKGRREERKVRRQLRREREVQKVKKEVGGKGDDSIEFQKKFTTVRVNPFPGRGALLRRVQSRDL